MDQKLLQTSLLAALLLAACDSEADKQTAARHPHSESAAKTSEVEPNMEPAAASNESASLDKQFLPPNFLVNKIETQVTSQSLKLVIRYTLSESLYQVLEAYQDFYVAIQYPEELSRVTNVEQSEPVKAPVPQNGQLSHSVTITSSWNKPLPKHIMDHMRNGAWRYNLVILDRDRLPVHIFNDVQWYQTFDPNRDSHIIFEDAENEGTN